MVEPKLILVMWFAGCLVFVILADSMNPMRISRRRKRRRLHRVALITSVVLAVSPLALLIKPVDGLIAQLRFCLLVSAATLLAILLCYGIYSAVRPSKRKRRNHSRHTEHTAQTLVPDSSDVVQDDVETVVADLSTVELAGLTSAAKSSLDTVVNTSLDAACHASPNKATDTSPAKTSGSPLDTANNASVGAEKSPATPSDAATEETGTTHVSVVADPNDTPGNAVEDPAKRVAEVSGSASKSVLNNGAIDSIQEAGESHLQVALQAAEQLIAEQQQDIIRLKAQHADTENKLREKHAELLEEREKLGTSRKMAQQSVALARQAAIKQKQLQLELVRERAIKSRVEERAQKAMGIARSAVSALGNVEKKSLADRDVRGDQYQT